MSIAQFCNRNVVVADRATMVSEAARRMRELHVGCLVVVDSLGERKRPVGIVTDRDIVVEVVAQGLAADTLAVGEIVTEHVKTVRDDAGVYDTLRYMRELGIRRMPVVDGAGALVGLVTVDDYLELMAEEMGEIVKLIAGEQRRESVRRP